MAGAPRCRVAAPNLGLPPPGPLQAELLAEEGADPPTWPKNAALGRFTNFVNLLDMCALSIPSGLMTIDAEAAAEVGRCGWRCCKLLQGRALSVPGPIEWPEARAACPRPMC